MVALVSVMVATGCSGTVDEDASSSPAPTTNPAPTTDGVSAEDVSGRVDVPTDDLCGLFTGDEILAIATAAYRLEGSDAPIPSELVGTTNAIGDGVLCEWTVPGTLPGWGRGDFTVSLSDESDVPAGYNEDGSQVDYTWLDEYHRVGPGSKASLYGVAELVPEGVVFLGGFSPGFNVYVERVDRVFGFRHDPSIEVQQQPGWVMGEITVEHTRLELRILSEMLHRLGWIDA